MKNKILIAFALSLAVAFSAQVPVSATEKKEGTTAPDNTKMNKEVRDNKEVTADQQKEKDTDRKMTQKIRRSVVKDKSLSTYAHNVKIITQGGMVTLKGPVRSEQEKEAIEKAAAQVAGKGKVTNELTVKPEEKSKDEKTKEKK